MWRLTFPEPLPWLAEDAFPEAFRPWAVQQRQHAAFGAVEALAKILHGVRQMAFLLLKTVLSFLHHGKFFFQIRYPLQCVEVWGESGLLRAVAHRCIVMLCDALRDGLENSVKL